MLHGDIELVCFALRVFVLIGHVNLCRFQVYVVSWVC